MSCAVSEKLIVGFTSTPTFIEAIPFPAYQCNANGNMTQRVENGVTWTQLPGSLLQESLTAGQSPG
jgi:hypothetical protein